MAMLVVGVCVIGFARQTWRGCRYILMDLTERRPWVWTLLGIVLATESALVAVSWSSIVARFTIPTWLGLSQETDWWAVVLTGAGLIVGSAPMSYRCIRWLRFLLAHEDEGQPP